MREICLDTETTGLKPEEGHRIIEIGAVELIDKVPTGKEFHVYVNPQRDVPEEAVKVHGITAEMLADKPLFEQIAQDFLEFIGDAKLVIHNAAFDRKFLNAELERCGLPMIAPTRCVDTLLMARAAFPGAPASLDALCKRFGIDNSHRALHGALLDAQILAEVYLELAGGRQRALGLDTGGHGQPRQDAPRQQPQHARRATPLPPRLDAATLERHATFVQTMGGNALWEKWLKQG